MTTYSLRLCCEPGCAAVARSYSTGWYSVPFGFMQWACPDHVAIWAAHHAERKRYEDRCAAEGKRLQAEMDRAMDAWTEANPAPPWPESQDSTSAGFEERP